MTFLPGNTAIRAILLDIEGTTTPLDFVYQVLFSYARNRVREFLERHHGEEEVRADIAALRREHAADLERQLDPPPWREDSVESQLRSLVGYVHWLMDRDRKSTGLKSLQGKIWEAGYRKGELRGQVYADVPPALERWTRQKKDVCIFSSGSVLAQELLFGNTTEGDLTRFLRAYFDTTTGPKTEAESYRRIAVELGLPASEMLFISDVTAELDAARRAGMQTALCARPGRMSQSRQRASAWMSPEPAAATHPVIQTFDPVFP